MEAVELLGAGRVAFEQTGQALSVTLPERRPTAFVPALKLRGANLI